MSHNEAREVLFAMNRLIGSMMDEAEFDTGSDYLELNPETGKWEPHYAKVVRFRDRWWREVLHGSDHD